MPNRSVDAPARDAGVVPDAGGEASGRRSAPDGARRDIVAIGTSAGGVKALKKLVAALPPNEADHPEMPMNALMHNRIDHRLPLEGIAALLTRLAQEAPDPFEPQDPPRPLEDELQSAKLSRSTHSMGDLGRLSPFTCPGCRGALWELEEGEHLRYRCHTGHAYSQASLLVDQGVAVEESLYTAVRSMQEKAAALRRLAERWPERMPSVKQEYEQRAAELDRSADVLRGMLARKQL